MTDTRVEIIPIPDPAMIVLHNIEFDPPDVIDELTAAIETACGHRRFVLFVTHDDGTIRTIADPHDALRLVEAAIRQQEESDGHEG